MKMRNATCAETQTSNVSTRVAFYFFPILWQKIRVYTSFNNYSEEASLCLPLTKNHTCSPFLGLMGISAFKQICETGVFKKTTAYQSPVSPELSPMFARRPVRSSVHICMTVCPLALSQKLSGKIKFCGAKRSHGWSDTFSTRGERVLNLLRDEHCCFTARRRD